MSFRLPFRSSRDAVSAATLLFLGFVPRVEAQPEPDSVAPPAEPVAAPRDEEAEPAPAEGEPSEQTAPADAPADASEEPEPSKEPSTEPAGEPAEPAPPLTESTAETVALAPAAFEGEEAKAPAAPEGEKTKRVVEPVEVVVAGSKVEKLAGSAHVIGRKQLERFEYDDAQAILQQIPGVYVRQEDGVGLRPNIGMRGVNPDRSKKLTLMEDGILFGPAPYSAPAAYYFPLMTRMVQVRAIKGPGSIAYGPQTVGGAIDLITRSAEKGTHGAVDLALGQYLYQKQHAYLSHADDQVKFVLEGTRLANTGFKDLPSGGDTGFTRNEWMAKVSYLLDPQATDQHEFSLKATYSDEASNETYVGLSDADFRSDPLRRYPASQLDRMENHRTSLVLGYSFEGAGQARPKLKVNVYRHDYDRSWRKFNKFVGADAFNVLTDPENPGNLSYYEILRGNEDSVLPAENLLIGPNHRTFVSQGIQTVFTLNPKTGPLAHGIEAGVRLHNDSIRRVHSQDEFSMQGGELYPTGAPTDVWASNLDETFATALHVLDAIQWKRVLVTPGVRVEIIHGRTNNYLTNRTGTDSYVAVLPGASAYVGITDQLGVLGGAHRGFSPSNPGSGDSPESSINYEAGARYQNEHVRAEVVGFYNDYSNMTDNCTLSSGCQEDLGQQFSAGAARIYGLEAYARTEPRLGAWSFPATLAYTLTRGEFLTSFDSKDPIFGQVTAGDQVPYLPDHQLNATVAVEERRVGASAAVTYVSRMREIAGGGAVDETLATDEQIWADLGAYYRPLPWLEIYANLRNAFDGQFIVSRRPYGARPNAPRWFQMGVKAKF